MVSKKNHITCPKCKRVYKLPCGGAVTDLPTNNFELCILQLLKDRRSWWLFNKSISYLHQLFLIIWICFLSFWCLTCDAVPEPSCHDSHYIVLDRSKDVDELCGLLLVSATFSSDVVTVRERYQSNLLLELEGLQAKVKAVELLMAENSSRLEQRRLIGLQSRVNPHYWPTAIFRSRRA